MEAERLTACDDAIALLREIADLETDDAGDVILVTDEHGHNDLLARIAAFLAKHDQQEEPTMTKLTETQTIILGAGVPSAPTTSPCRCPRSWLVRLQRWPSPR